MFFMNFHKCLCYANIQLLFRILHVLVTLPKTGFEIKLETKGYHRAVKFILAALAKLDGHPYYIKAN